MDVDADRPANAFAENRGKIKMVDSKNFTIGVLSVTAVVLFVGLVVLNQLPAAHAFGQTAAGGDYVISTAQYSNSLEVLCILDAAESKMIAYAYDANRKRIEQVAGFDLQRLREDIQRRSQNQQQK